MNVHLYMTPHLLAVIYFTHFFHFSFNYTYPQCLGQTIEVRVYDQGGDAVNESDFKITYHTGGTLGYIYANPAQNAFWWWW